MADFNHFQQLADALEEASSQIVRKTAFDIQADAANLAPVDTGFLRNSIYVATWDASTYGHGGITPELLDEVETPGSEQEAIVAVGAEYGIYIEFGTRFMPADPYFFQAVDFARPYFEDAMARLEERMQGLVR